MTNEQILKKAIEKALVNGCSIMKLNGQMGLSTDELRISLDYHKYYRYIFSHDFAEAIWGKQEVELSNPSWSDYLPIGDDDLDHDTLPAWQYHLQNMVKEKEPLKYLEMFVNDEMKSGGG